MSDSKKGTPKPPQRQRRLVCPNCQSTTFHFIERSGPPHEYFLCTECNTPVYVLARVEFGHLRHDELMKEAD